jgi:drug/metabolite transporter (DMT)-like permease
VHNQYGQAIRVLGVSRAVLFPAMVPAVSIMIGIPIVGEFPDAVQIYGLLLVTVGLLGAFGMFPLRRRRSRPMSGSLVGGFENGTQREPTRS